MMTKNIWWHGRRLGSYRSVFGSIRIQQRPESCWEWHHYWRCPGRFLRSMHPFHPFPIRRQSMSGREPVWHLYSRLFWNSQLLIMSVVRMPIRLTGGREQASVPWMQKGNRKWESNQPINSSSAVMMKNGDSGIDSDDLMSSDENGFLRRSASGSNGLEFSLIGGKRKILSRNASKGGPNFVRRWLNRFPTRSKKVDILSRVVFPLLFAMFNLFYWVNYLWRDDLKDLDI